MYIAIAGNIGSGKTTLTELLAKKCNAKIYYEETNNPYLGDFYNDMSRWSFNLQIYFLGSRIEQASQILGCKSDLIQDRTIYEDAHIFADNLHQMGLMSSRDFGSYMKIFDIASHLIPKPDLLIYLKASVPTLINQIKKRGREYEMAIQQEYLERLNIKYNYWIENIYQGEVMVIDKDVEDFIEHPAVMERIMSRVDEIKTIKE